MARRDRARRGGQGAERRILRRDDEHLVDPRAQRRVRGGGHRDGRLADGEHRDTRRCEDKLAPRARRNGADEDTRPAAPERLGNEGRRIDGRDCSAIELHEDFASVHEPRSLSEVHRGE